MLKSPRSCSEMNKHIRERDFFSLSVTARLTCVRDAEDFHEVNVQRNDLIPFRAKKHFAAFSLERRAQNSVVAAPAASVSRRRQQQRIDLVQEEMRPDARQRHPLPGVVVGHGGHQVIYSRIVQDPRL